jgi:hypothetical protein
MIVCLSIDRSFSSISCFGVWEHVKWESVIIWETNHLPIYVNVVIDPLYWIGQKIRPSLALFHDWMQPSMWIILKRMARVCFDFYNVWFLINIVANKFYKTLTKQCNQNCLPYIDLKNCPLWLLHVELIEFPSTCVKFLSIQIMWPRISCKSSLVFEHTASCEIGNYETFRLVCMFYHMSYF